MSKPKKIGKDVFDKKSSGILRTEKDRAEYEEYKRKRAEEATKEKEEEEKKKTIGSEKMPDEREPTSEQLAKQKAEVLADIRKLKLKKVVLKKEE